MDKIKNNPTPLELQNIIISTTNELIDVYEKIQIARTNLTLKQAALYDKEQQYRTIAFTDNMAVSKVREFIKWNSHDAEKAHEQAKSDLYALHEEKEIREQILNSAKILLRGQEMEAKSLHYTGA